MHDARVHGMAGAFRGQSVGLAKAVLSLTLFHEGRQWCMRVTKRCNERFAL